MKKLLTLAILFAACVAKANTYVHYSTNDNTEWCQVYDDNGKWMAAYKIVWKDETDMVGNVTLYNWNEKCLSILKPSADKDDKHIYLRKEPKKTATLMLALNS